MTISLPPEFMPRDGLPRVLAKLAAGGDVRIAYLGGSITDADGWRVKTTSWFRQRFPQTVVSEIQAAIGGTGSDLGVYRFGHDVLRHRPDLVFVEFAVNDSSAPTQAILQGMEGIVRQAWRADPTIELCFVYTLTGSMLAELQAGRRPASIQAMEQVAGHYRISAIDLGPEVATRVQAGSLIFRAQSDADLQRANVAGQAVFSSDDVHPLAAGHALYAEVVTRCLARLSPGPDLPHTLGPVLVEDNLEQAKLLPVDRLSLGQGWRRLDPQSDALARTFGRRLPSLYAAHTHGSSLAFSFRGSAVGFYDLLGPDCGQVQVRVDGGPLRLVPRFDGYCTYHRLACLAIATGLPVGVHRVEIAIAAVEPDKAAVLFPDNRQDLQTNPAKYAGTSWYVGGVLLVGELVG